MSSARPQQDCLVARALGEALESVTTPPVRDSVIARALLEAGYSSVPERGPEVIEFAEGPLMRALARRLGDDVATEVLDQVRPVLLRASMRPSLRPATPRYGTARPVRPSPTPVCIEVRSTRPAPVEEGLVQEEDSGVFYSLRSVGDPRALERAARALTDPAPLTTLPTVFFVSQDADAAIALAIALGGRATVRVVEGLLDLMDALEEDAEGGARIVALDGRRPVVQVPSLVTVAPELAGRATILVWRASPEDRSSIDDARTVTEAWRSCGEGIPDLAARCALEIGLLEIG